MATKEEILDAISSMTVLELSELLKDFEEKFGVTAAAPVAVAAAGALACGASLTAPAGAVVPGCHTAASVPSTTITVAILMPVAHRLSGGFVLRELIIVS